MKKYREFWIGFPDAENPEVLTKELHDFSHTDPRGAFQVIEKSALTDLQAENARLREALENMNCDYRLISTSGGTVASHIDSCRKCNALSPQEKE